MFIFYPKPKNNDLKYNPNLNYDLCMKVQYLY